MLDVSASLRTEKAGSEVSMTAQGVGRTQHLEVRLKIASTFSEAVAVEIILIVNHVLEMGVGRHKRLEGSCHISTAKLGLCGKKTSCVK